MYLLREQRTTTKNGALGVNICFKSLKLKFLLQCRCGVVERYICSGEGVGNRLGLLCICNLQYDDNEF